MSETIVLDNNFLLIFSFSKTSTGTVLTIKLEELMKFLSSKISWPSILLFLRFFTLLKLLLKIRIFLYSSFNRAYKTAFAAPPYPTMIASLLNLSLCFVFSSRDFLYPIQSVFEPKNFFSLTVTQFMAPMFLA